MMDLLVWFLLLTVLVCFMSVVWAYHAFRGWKRTLEVALVEGSSMIDTRVGKVEYCFRGKGPVVLHVHGAPGGYDQSIAVSERWLSDGFAVLALSRPGYLRTPLEVGVSYEEQAEVIEAVLDALGIDKVAVVGTSAGGAVALNFVLQHPERVWSLVIIAGVSKEFPVRDTVRSSSIRRIIFSDTLSDIGVWLFDVIARRWPAYSLRQMLSENTTLSSDEVRDYVDTVIERPNQVARYKKFIRTNCPLSLRKDGLLNDLEQLARTPITGLRSVSLPTLVIHGTADRDVPFTNAEYTASSIPGAELYSLKDVGHVIWLGNHVPKTEKRLLEFFHENKPNGF